MIRICVVMTLFASGLFAQTSDTASIYGFVTDQSRSTVPDALITAINLLTGYKRTVSTDASGRFAIAGLPAAGEYEISANKPGFSEARSTKVTPGAGTAANVNFQLIVSGGVTEVTVSGTPGDVRADSPQLGNRLDALQIQEMPLINNRVSYLPLLSAANHQAINQGDVFMNQNLFTTNGAGRRQTWFELDGSTGNDGWGRQTMFSNIPAAAVQEMTVLENEFSAEYGGSTGSAVNIVTKSGGNQFHGEVREVWRPAALEAALSGFNSKNAASGNDVTSDTLGQSSISLSGPLIVPRTNFFIAGELSREDRASPIISPIAPGSFVGHYRGGLEFGRIDRQINERHSLFFRSDNDVFHDTNPNGIVGGNNLPTVARLFRRRTYSQEIGETAVLSPSLLNNLRLQFQLASPITQFDPLVYGTQYSVPISAGGTFTTGTSQSALLMNRQYQLSDTLSKIVGSHQIKLGGSVIVAHSGGNSKEFGGPIYLGQFLYNTCTQPIAICESPSFLKDIANVRTYTQSYDNASYTVDDTLWAVFMQDDYHARNGLTLNFGLRYEQQTFTDSRKDFAPRVGFAYSVHGQGNSVLRGGFGIYHSQIVDNSEANYALTGPTGVFNYTASPGQIGFPATIAGAPLPAFPLGAVPPLRNLYVRPGNSTYLDHFFPTSALIGYPNALLNPYSEQWTFGVEHRLYGHWVLSVDYIGSHTLHINRPLDVDPPAPFFRTAQGQIRSPQAANCTRPYWMAWYRQNNMICNQNAPTNPQPPYAVIQSDVNNGYSFYDALNVNLTHRFSRRLSMLASYTWAHAIDNVDPDVPSQNPNDPNFTGKTEKGDAIFDQRQRFVLSGYYTVPLKITVGGVFTGATGLPYNLVTGTTNSGDTGATTDRPVINGTVVGRNTGRGTPFYDFSPFLERTLIFGDRVKVTGRAESFNSFNHLNQVGFSGTYGNDPGPGTGFGFPLAGVTNQLSARSVQFSLRAAF